jgi:hypothetical protein
MWAFDRISGLEPVRHARFDCLPELRQIRRARSPARGAGEAVGEGRVYLAATASYRALRALVIESAPIIARESIIQMA